MPRDLCVSDDKQFFCRIQILSCTALFLVTYLLPLLFSVSLAAPCRGDETELIPAELPQAGGPSRRAPRVYKLRIDPHWIGKTERFWYRNDVANGGREFIFVDAGKGVRRQAFDHDRLAAALTEAGVECSGEQLPFREIYWPQDDAVVAFRAGGKIWRCSLSDYELTPGGEDDLKQPPLPPGFNSERLASPSSDDDTHVVFVNRSKGVVELLWIDSNGRRRSYGRLEPGKEKEQHTFAGHLWEVVDKDRNILKVFAAPTDRTRVAITGEVIAPPRRRRQRGSRGGGSSDRSADEKWRVFIRDHNIFVRDSDNDDEIQLTKDGSADRPYESPRWSPDSKTLAAWSVVPGENKEVHLVESSPAGGGRARLRSRGYPLPGDRFASYELCLLNVEEKRVSRPKVAGSEFGRPRVRWSDDGRKLYYQLTDRGHQRFRLVEVDIESGESRNVIDEKSETFIWTAHADHMGMRKITWLEETDELLFMSEMGGWRQLYLVSREGGIQQAITPTGMVVRGVDRIDEQRREVWFHACGAIEGQDPYFIHYYRVKFDGTELAPLTAGDGTHAVKYSPDRSYLIDTYSRVDMAPVHELRRVADGKIVCELEKADVSELVESGWRAPDVFVAKGRDDKTDIWGFICQPTECDPNSKYPIIESIYAGPHNSHVPKSFSAARRFASLVDLGFAVVKIDGMGTANRSKAFHDVCWHNLKDAGFPDRIRWIQAAATKYSFLDTSRVGVYGTSAGGQNAAGALLFHPDFYKAAVAACGCHDNRMDKASWNEQWMGYPVGPHYSESSNIDNAGRLQGKLLLIVGELDTNVPPESTMRFVDALIKAKKDFDLLVMPNTGHSSGGSYGARRLRDFFVRHLQDKQPPDRNRQTD
ncbi:MAG: prolyl oligopeptidase family serine peptidase [Pirellulaceae bacterium]|jgi:dienelactone hydrolase|nr:prolyl oligopeptidase family serine peptidase [Pirellulaceae bacterium]MDP7019186.1 prolyl oligopeptidase family serine peptidase [Pirellulaceae bacterium]